MSRSVKNRGESKGSFTLGRSDLLIAIYGGLIGLYAALAWWFLIEPNTTVNGPRENWIAGAVTLSIVSFALPFAHVSVLVKENFLLVNNPVNSWRVSLNKVQELSGCDILLVDGRRINASALTPTLLGELSGYSAKRKRLQQIMSSSRMTSDSGEVKKMRGRGILRAASIYLGLLAVWTLLYVIVPGPNHLPGP